LQHPEKPALQHPEKPALQHPETKKACKAGFF
jgi:hypothetical protein